MEPLIDSCGKKWFVTNPNGLRVEVPAPPAAQGPNQKRKYERKITMTKEYSLTEVLAANLRQQQSLNEPLVPLAMSVLTIFMDPDEGEHMTTTPIYDVLAPFFKRSSIAGAISFITDYMEANDLAVKETLSQPNKERRKRQYIIDSAFKAGNHEDIKAAYADYRRYANERAHGKRLAVKKAASPKKPDPQKPTPKEQAPLPLDPIQKSMELLKTHIEEIRAWQAASSRRFEDIDKVSSYMGNEVERIEGLVQEIAGNLAGINEADIANSLNSVHEFVKVTAKKVAALREWKEGVDAKFGQPDKWQSAVGVYITEKVKEAITEARLQEDVHGPTDTKQVIDFNVNFKFK